MKQDEMTKQLLAHVRLDPFLLQSSTLLRVAQDVDELLYNRQGDPTPAGFSLRDARWVLSVPCGAGVWEVETAKTYPHLLIRGVDPDGRLVKVARWYALMEEIANVSFTVSEVQRMPYLPDESFDFVQVRFLCQLLPPEHWMTTIRELLRVCRCGGVLAWTELGALQTNSAACEYWYRLLQQAVMQYEQGAEIEALLSSILCDAGAAHIQHEVLSFDLADDSPLARFLYRHLYWLTWMAEAFLLQSGLMERDELEELQRQVRHDVLETRALEGTLSLTTAWAKK